MNQFDTKNIKKKITSVGDTSDLINRTIKNQTSTQLTLLKMYLNFKLIK